MKPAQHRGHWAAARFANIFSVCVTASVLIAAAATSRTAHAGDIPAFAVDASWPKQLPNNWIMGQVGGITVDWQGHIWVIQRPRSLTEDEKGVTLNPPRSKCCVPAPPVLEFDADGNLLRSWGGPGEGYEWVGREHGIEVDERGFVWIGGNADNDDVLLKFTLDGKFVMPTNSTSPTATATVALLSTTLQRAPISGTGAPMAIRPTTTSSRLMIPRHRRSSSSAIPCTA